MYPKEFIQNTLIDEMKDIVCNHPFLSFALISTGIEFLGKCILTDRQTFDYDLYKPGEAFNEGEKLLIDIDFRYNNLELRNELRNGFVHTLRPGTKISLSEVKAGDDHFGTDSKGKTILVAEILYRDFVKACKRVIKKSFEPEDKMNMGFLDIYD